MLLRVAGLVVVVALAWRAHRLAWGTRATLEYLTFGHLMVLSSGTTLHNNYLVWVLPLVSLYLVVAVSQNAHGHLGDDQAHTR
jgi:hypothetical protein